ncbi:MAG: tetratricopeptide repeat protein [Acidobacteria bacterium]|nr:tetratricopeptide repeat protein [Acidobacteriota bacterium]
MLKHLLATSSLTLLLATPLLAQNSAQKLYERGAFDEVVQRVNTEREAGNDDPVSAYLAGQALLKLDRNNDARAEFARLSNGNNQTWQAIGQSAIALLDNALDEANNEGRRARDLSGESGFAFYQLGLVLIKRGEFDEASQVLDRAAELMPEFAYAHYNAGVAHQRAKRFSQMADRFQSFLKLAPDAPERRQVQLALNALRG